ncbi:MAG: hypothetical protein CL843_15625 [Crocinitomicaceae bacterium]|nr:hypothetical protein [Crocinitomicaceae bacterium]|tara:strand:+ start:2734 stop:3570 length:837 start_codon:yes stop_codon:yes gene_type:complete
MKVILIAGSGQSGSTLLTLLLGAHPDILNGGELFTLFHYMKKQPDKPCLDGYKLNDHPLWSLVISEISKRESLKNRIKSKKKEIFNAAFRELIEIISMFSDKKAIVITSKQFWRIKNILEDDTSDLEICTIHLIRDPRAKVNSKLKRSKGMKKWYYTFNKSLSWSLTNLKCSSLSKKREIYFLKYEDLTYNVENMLQELMRHCDITFSSIQITYYNTEQPLFSGNGQLINRRDPVVFRRDFLKMKIGLWCIITILTFPINIVFGYPVLKRGYKKYASN